MGWRETPLYRRDVVNTFVRRYYRAHMTSTVRVYRGLSGSRVLVYQGPARVHRLSSPVQLGFGDEPQYMVAGTVSVPYTDAAGIVVDIHVNDLVVVDHHPDVNAIGRSMRVTHVDAGGEFEEMIQLSVVGSEESPTTGDLPVPPRSEDG